MSIETNSSGGAGATGQADLDAPAQSGGWAIIGKLFIFLFMLALWFFIGGFFTIGPHIAHNIEHAVGSFALMAPVVAWIALPFTGSSARCDEQSRWHGLPWQPYSLAWPAGLFFHLLVQCLFLTICATCIHVSPVGRNKRSALRRMSGVASKRF